MRRPKLTLLFALSTALLTLGAGPSGESAGQDEEQKSVKEISESPDADLPIEATGVIAVIDGEEITAEQFNAHVRRLVGDDPRAMPRRMAERMKPRQLESVVDKFLLDRVIEQADVEISEEAIDAEFRAFADRFPKEKALERILEQRNQTRRQLRSDMAKDLALREILRKRDALEITDQQARTYYREHKSKYVHAEKVRARHIMIEARGDASEKEKARAEAEKLAEKAREEGVDFAELARKHSDGPSATKGGDLGYFEKEKMVPAFSKAAFSMKDGAIRGPVESEFGFHVIKRVGHKPARTQKFEDVKPEIVETLEKKRLREALDAFVSELREKAEIETKPENIRVNDAL